MAKKPELPAEVHDHFSKANVLHGYVQKDLGEATKHALETGQELLAAKAATPHGRWDKECERLFDGSLRTAQFYMAFAKHVSALPKAQSSALLLLEGSLDGAAKAAKKLAKPPAPKPPSPTPPAGEPDEEAPESPQTAPEPEGDSESAEPAEGRRTGNQGPPRPSTAEADYGKCPNCAGTKWEEDEDGVSCAKCYHPWGEPAGDPDDEKTIRKREAAEARAQVQVWSDTVGRWLRGAKDSQSIDDIRKAYPSKEGDRVVKAATELREALKLWPKKVK